MNIDKEAVDYAVTLSGVSASRVFACAVLDAWQGVWFFGGLTVAAMILAAALAIYLAVKNRWLRKENRHRCND